MITFLKGDKPFVLLLLNKIHSWSLYRPNDFYNSQKITATNKTIITYQLLSFQITLALNLPTTIFNMKLITNDI